MKSFKEMIFLLEEEELLIWEECFLIDENWITTPLKFAAGAGGNLLTQTARGIGNVSSGFVGNLGAIGDVGLGTLQTLGGGHKKGLQRIKKGLKTAGKSGERIGRGVTQTMGALSGVTPLLRGAQASSEPIGIKGIYSPPVKKGSFSDLFGLGSWDDEDSNLKKSSIKPPPVPQKFSSIKPPTVPQKSSSIEPPQKSSSSQFEGPVPNKECKKLIRAYKNSKNVKERRQIQKKMAIVDPVWYKHIMQKAKERTKIRS